MNRYDSRVLQNDGKGATKRGISYTRGTAMSFGFRRRPSSGIPMPVGNVANDEPAMHQRSKSAGPAQERRRDEDENRHERFHSASSGRSTPRLAPPKKESAMGSAVRTNRFGFRQPQPRYTNKVADLTMINGASHCQQEKIQQQEGRAVGRPTARTSHPPNCKLGGSPVRNVESDRRGGTLPEPVSKYTLHTSHLPLPQYAVRMSESATKVAKTAANQCRKVSTGSKGSTSSKEGSGTEDSGIGSQQGCANDRQASREFDYSEDSGSTRGRRNHGRARNLRMILSGKSFDVRDVDDDSTVTEISVIPLPKSFANGANVNNGFVRDRTVEYQRILNKDNRYTDSISISTTSMSTTSSEGYDEGLGAGEEKAYKDRSRTEKIPSIKSDFSPPSSDDPEYGHGEAMADEYSLSSSDECRANPTCHLKIISNAAKSGSLPNGALRSVLLTIEDPAFAAAAATATTLIDDETSPVDSLVDSLTASIAQSDGKNSRKECIAIGNNICDDDSPGTPTNASNSLSLSEGREFFDDEIADQPALTFDDALRGGENHSSLTSRGGIADNTRTLVESLPKSSSNSFFPSFLFVYTRQVKITLSSFADLSQVPSVENSPIHGRRISRAGSIDTLSPCESIASDDLMLDYECTDDRSIDESSRR